MGKKILSEEQKNKILDMVLNTRKTYKKIADINGTSLEQVYDLIEEYCREKNYETIRRTKNGVEFGKQTDGRKRPKILKNVQEIQKWVEENGRKPRQKIKGVKTVKKRKKETEEQEELRLGRAFNNTRNSVMKGYEGKDLEEIKDKTDRKIVRIIREIDENYESKRQGSLRNTQEIEKWVEENGRKPRQKIKGVKTVKKGEKETEEQEELRLGHALNHIRTFVMKGYEGKDLEEIKDKTDREMVRIIREIDENYEDNLKTYYEKLRKKEKDKPAKRNVKFVQKLGNEKMGKMIINLIKTKNATEEQVKTIADFYGVDLGKIANIHEER